MDSTAQRIDHIEVNQTDDELSLGLISGGSRAVSFRLRYENRTDEVINSLGTVAHGPGSWTLIGRELSLEFGPRTAETLGYPRDYLLHLDVDDESIRQVRAALLEILECACFIVDTPEGRITS